MTSGAAGRQAAPGDVAAPAAQPWSGGWPAVVAVALGIFSLMTSELLPVGLLTPVRSELGVSDGTAGLMVTVPGLVAAVSAPLIAVYCSRLDRRLLLSALIGLVGAANLACAVAPDFAVVLAARVLVGVGVGGFWATAGGLAVRLVPPVHIGRATAVIFGGVSTASVLGVPAGTFLGQVAGWRAAFASVGLLAVVAVICTALAMPSVPGMQASAMSGLTRLFRGSSGVRVGLLVTFLLVTGHFTAYTFVRPILQNVSGVDGSLISPLLLAYGVAGVAGNFVLGVRASRHLHRTLVLVCIAIAATLVLVALVGGVPAVGIALLVVWGLAYGAVSVSLQIWILTAAPLAADAATSLFVAVFNLSIAFGAVVGAVAVDSIATAAALWVGAGLVLLAGVAVGISARAAIPARQHHNIEGN
jgi:predicted MFS family arabinose efflux permease